MVALIPYISLDHVLDSPTCICEVEDEPMQDLACIRENSLNDPKALKRRLKSSVLRPDIYYSGKANCGSARLRWLANNAALPTAARRSVLKENTRGHSMQ